MKFTRSPRHVRANAITRRQALRRLGALAGAATLSPLLSACGDDDGSRSAAALLPEELDIETIIVVMMENRSFDHYFGSFSLHEGRRIDGLQPGFFNPRLDGSPVQPFHMGLRCVADPPHSFGSSHDQVNNGANDGFVREHASRVGAEHGDEVMGYYVRDQLPFLYSLADQFVLCQQWHCSVLGPTWPNRMFLHSAQSNGRKNNDLPDTPAGFTWPTIYDSLTAAGIPWKSYFSDLPMLFLWGSLQRQADRIRRIEEFYEDAQSGTLPAVCHIEPSYRLNDDHPPHDIRLGQAFLSSIVHAVGQSPQWERSMILITYDEHGGFFDHVAPGTVADERADQGFGQLGVRVPGLVISPYSPAGLISSTLYEHSSVPAFIEWLFGLEPLTLRDANANFFLDAFDAREVRRGNPRPFPALPVVEVDPDSPPECAAFGAGGSVQDIELFADAGGIPRDLDLRGEAHETLRRINRHLLRMGAGRRVRLRP
jgi:phospholipase C